MDPALSPWGAASAANPHFAAAAMAAAAAEHLRSNPVAAAAAFHHHLHHNPFYPPVSQAAASSSLAGIGGQRSLLPPHLASGPANSLVPPPSQPALPQSVPEDKSDKRSIISSGSKAPGSASAAVHQSAASATCWRPAVTSSSTLSDQIQNTTSSKNCSFYTLY